MLTSLKICGDEIWEGGERPEFDELLIQLADMFTALMDVTNWDKLASEVDIRDMLAVTPEVGKQLKDQIWYYGETHAKKQMNVRTYFSISHSIQLAITQVTTEVYWLVRRQVVGEMNEDASAN